jgi:anaphase-promoting complex subunit 10
MNEGMEEVNQVQDFLTEDAVHESPDSSSMQSSSSMNRIGGQDDVMDVLLSVNDSKHLSSFFSFNDLADKREIGHEAVWTLSTAKPGNGIEQLRDNNLETFWQSDGMQPHIVSMQFHRKSRITEISLYVDFKLDESYTPAKIAIKAGSGFHDVTEVQTLDLQEPVGWITIPLRAVKDDGEYDGPQVLRAHIVQLVVLSSHMNGRDTHIRQIKIFGPRQPATKNLGTDLSEFSTTEFDQFSQIR